MLSIQHRNHPNIITLLILLKPFITCVLRELVLSYIMFIVKNIAAEHRPCEIIIIRDLIILEKVKIEIAAIVVLI